MMTGMNNNDECFVGYYFVLNQFLCCKSRIKYFALKVIVRMQNIRGNMVRNQLHVELSEKKNRSEITAKK